MQAQSEELAVPLLQDHEEDGAGEEISTAEEEGHAARQQGDVEQGLASPVGSEADASDKTEDDAAAEAIARASHLCGPGLYFGDLLRLAIFYWAIVSDALLMKELYSRQYLVLAGISTGFTVGPHVLMSVLLIIRQGWLSAASQACGFILTLNPFESLTPIPQGLAGLFVLAVGFIAYVLIAASGLIFVAYCVVCYLVTALLFSLLILDLAALVITVAPSKAIFKYTDLVYTENFKFSRLVLQGWLQSAPELVLLAFILWRNASPGGPAVVVPGPIIMQALAAHLLNFWDKTCLFRASAATSGCGPGRQLVLLLGVRGSCRLSLPVLKDNLTRVMRGGTGPGGGDGGVLRLSCHEEAPDTDSDAAASMVPEYLTPNNGGLLSPGQVMGLAGAVFGLYGGAEVQELVLELTPDVMVGKMLSQVADCVPNISKLRLVGGAARGRDAQALVDALLGWGGLCALQLHQVVVDEAGAAALTRLLEATPTLQQLELCRCKLRRRAASALAQGLCSNKTVRQLNLAGIRGLDEAGVCALAGAVSRSKVLRALNLAFVKLSMSAVDSLVQAINSSSSLRVVAVSQADLPVEGAAALVAAIVRLAAPKAPPSLACTLTLGTFPAQGLDDKLQFLVVADQDALLADAWPGLAERPPAAAAAAAAAGTAAAGAAPSPGSAEGGGEAGAGAGAGAAAALGGDVAPGGGGGGAARPPMLQLEGDSSSSGSSSGSGPQEHSPLLLPGSPMRAAAGGSSSQQQQHPTAAFGVASSPRGGALPSPAAAAAAALLPRASAAWFSGAAAAAVAAAASSGSSSSGSGGAGAHLASVASFTQPQDAPPGPPGGLGAARRGSSAGGGAGSSSSKAAEAGGGSGPCAPLVPPCLVLVAVQDECVRCMTQAPLLFAELDTLDLSGLGIGDEGAAGMAKTLLANPGLRRCILADNNIGEEGGAALAHALATNTSLQVLDLSGNEFSEGGVAALADATRNAAGLRQLRLLGNKIPFGLDTLRQLMQAEAANPQCCLVLVEEPSEVLDELHAAGDAAQAARASDFYARQQAYRVQRRARIYARQQRLARLDQQQPEEQQQSLEQQQPEQQQQPEEQQRQEQQQQQQGQHPGGDSAAAWICRGEQQQPQPPPQPAQPQLQVVTHPPAAAAQRGGSPSSSSGTATATATAAAAGPGSPSGGASGTPRSGGGGGGGAAGVSPSAGSGSLSTITTDEDTCGICFDNSNHVAIKYCGHRLCVDCYRKVWELSGTDATCPFCRARLEGYMYLDWPLE